MDFFWIYDLPNWAVILLITSSFVAISVGGMLLTRKYVERWLGFLREQNELVSYFISATGVFYGITVGLIAVGTWENYSSTSDIVSEEASALAALYRDANSYPEPTRTQLTAILKEYTEYVIHEAWPLQREGIVPAHGTEIVTVFRKKLYAFEPITESQKIIHGETLDQFNEFAQIRRRRLISVTEGLPSLMWWVIIGGGLLNLFLSYLFVVENKLLHVLLNAILGAVVGILVFLIVAMDYPFRGEFSIEPTAFQNVYDQLMK